MIDDAVQQAAVTSDATNLLVIGPPGCGKTELLAVRAESLIPKLRPNQRILALTFSNRARDNLSERMRAHLGFQRYRRFVRVTNFHGHAAEIIEAHCRTIQLDPSFILPTKQTLEKALRAVSSDENAIAAAKTALSQVKRRPLTDDEVAAALGSTGSALAISTEQARARSLQLHYDDLLRHAQRLLRIDEVANLYQQQYGAVLVDEFQDLSPQQLDLALRSCLGNRTFVGDPLQGIYSWAGAEPTAVEAELTALCGEPLRLTKSYRSSPAVLSMVNAVGVQLGAAELSSAIPGNWAVGAASAAVAFPTGADEASWVTARCSEILQQQPEATIGVIARSGWRRKLLNAGFAALPDIPCRHWDLAVDDPETIERLEHAANTLPRSANFTHLREKALADLNPDDVDGRSDILEAIAEIEEASAGEPSIRTAIRRYLRDEGDQAVMPGIHLLNAHTGKGQQFDWVFVPGLENGHVPDFRAVTAADLLEEQRVLLVMLSRAKASVVVSRSAQLTSKRGVPYSRDPSPWWSGLEAAATMSREQFEALTLAAPAGV